MEESILFRPLFHKPTWYSFKKKTFLRKWALLTFTPFKGLFFHLLEILSCVPLYRLVKIMRPSPPLPQGAFQRPSLVISCNSPSLPTYLSILSKTCELENLCPPWRLVKWGSHCNKNPKERLVYNKIDRKQSNGLIDALPAACSLRGVRRKVGCIPGGKKCCLLC